MGIFANYGLSQVELVGAGRYFKEGEYIVRIENTKMVKEGFKGDSVIIEAEVLYVDSSDEDAPPVGTTASHVIKLSGDKTKALMGIKNWMGFLCAASGADDPKERSDEEWDELATAAIQDNALKDLVLRLSCFITRTKEDKPFTVHKWLPEPTEAYLRKCGLA
jgi:hypothetical protein